MANTYVDYTASAGQTDFAFNFPYLEDEHIKVYINSIEKLPSDFTISTSPTTKIVLNTPTTGGETVRVRRKSQPNDDLVDFVNGSILTESELDRGYRHTRYLAEEASEFASVSLELEGSLEGSQITNGTVSTTKLADGSVTAAKISTTDAKFNVQSNGYVGIGNINPTHTLDVSGDVNVSLGNTFKINGANFLLDEDAMTSNSDTRGATQQSFKAYVDSQVLSKWDSGWVNQDDQPTSISVGNGATMVFDHDLGNAALGAVFSVYAAKDSSGTDMQQASFSFWEDTSGIDANTGIQLTSITNSVVNVQVSANGMMTVNSSGTVTGLGYVPFGSGSYSHIRLVLIG